MDSTQQQLANQRRRHANHLRQQARGRPINKDAHNLNQVRAASDGGLLCALSGNCGDSKDDGGSKGGAKGGNNDGTSKSSSSPTPKAGGGGGGGGNGGSGDTKGASKGDNNDSGGSSKGNGGKGNSNEDDGGLLGGLFGGHTSKTPATTKTPDNTPAPKKTSAAPPPPPSSSSSSKAPVVPKVTVTSTSSSSTSTSSSIVPTSTSAPLLVTPAIPTTPNVYTTYAYVTASDANLAQATAGSSSSDGPGAGPIIGIVAGSLAGVVVLTVIIGFIIKKMRNKPDPYEANPFDRDAFHRHSTMLPDYDDDELDGGAPSMTEHHNMAGGGGGYDAAALAAVGGVVGGIASHHDNGPRPPTMFQKHINGPAAQYGGQQQYQNDMYAEHDQYNTPQLPPMAFGAAAGDPYGHQMSAANVANPYAHLDRGASQRSQADAHQMYGGGYPVHDQQHLDRTFSQGSQQSRSGGQGQWASPHDSYGHEEDEQFDTAGRPSTAEGRSGTPDLPNVQQTYAAQDAAGGHGHVHGMYDSAAQAAHQEHLHADMSPGAGSEGNNSTLSVRNLLPTNGAGAQRPLSAVSSNADPEDAYGGVY